MRKILLTILVLFITTNAWATIRYVRVDGGNGTQCLGTSDQPYDGSGAGEACAVNHPLWIFPARSESTSRAAVAGDTVVVGSGSYRMGCQNAATCRDSNFNLTQSAFCHVAYPYDCYPGAVPSNVTIVGCTINGCANPASRPELWGAGRVGHVLSTISSSNVVIKDIEITDHDDCGTGHATLDCGAADSSELSGSDGINIRSSTNLTLTNVKIHGMRRYGLYGGSVNGLTLTNTNLDYNAYGGWDGDSCGNSSCGQSGTLLFQSGTTVNYNGCIEDNPGYGTIKALGCYSQDQSGYGDGIGSNGTVGTRIFQDMSISHNVSDGLDLLYHSGASGSVTIKRSLFEGNAGNAVKVPNVFTQEDSTIIGNCGYFYGQPFTCTSAACGFNFNHCRAFGNVYSINFKSGNSTTPKINSSTILSNGDVGILVNGNCTSGTDVLVNNSILRGGKHFGDSGLDTSSIYFDDNTSLCNSDFVSTNNQCFGWKEGSSACTGSNDNVADPLFEGTILQGSGQYTGYYTGADYAAQLTIASGSPARGRSDETVSGLDSYDYNSFDRGAAWDAGSLEFGTSGGQPPATCGDNVIEGSEFCDGTALNSQTCVTLGYASGTLACESDCSAYDTSACVTDPCGNGNIDGIEVCDTSGPNLNGQTCVSQGFASGTLACTAGCASFNTAGCVSVSCGDGSINQGSETCDDGNTTNSDGCSAICETEVAGIEKFLLYTEGDPTSLQTVTTHKTNVVGMTDETATYLRYDYGASYFGDFTHRFKVEVDSCTAGGSDTAYLGVYALSSSARTSLTELETNNDGIEIYLRCKSSQSSYTWRLRRNESATVTDAYVDVPPFLIRYIEVIRSGSTVTANIYSDALFTTLLDSLTVSTSTAFRYVYSLVSNNSAVSGVNISASVENLNLSVGSSPAVSTSTKIRGSKPKGGARIR